MSRPVHFEIHAEDPDRAAKFYNSVFGWSVKKWEGPVDYWVLTTGEKDTPGINGGIIKRHGASPPMGQQVNAYVCTMEVEDVMATIAKIVAGGGTLALELADYPGIGKLAYYADTEKNIFGVLEPVKKPA